ncbi:MAG: acetylornithine deacetylase [Rhodobacteraceae bacterium]|nr:acetylornithine deacetylase [Paracoccaceae bacterium]
MNLSAREMLDRLIAFPTVSRDTNLPLVDFMEEYLTSHGVTCHRDYDETGQKASLFAHIGPEIDGGVILSGHTDVVPVDGQDWVTDPWTVVEKDGKLYGRGTTDMKGFVALALAAVPKMKDLKRPIQLAFSYDEEVGLLGARPLVDAMKEALPRANACIVGEPTGMKVVSGHKSCDACFVDVRGFEVHSSKLHEGVSATMVAARLVNWLRQRSDANRDAPVKDEDAAFDPPYTTLHVGMLNGGTAHNITAKDCSFSVDVRNVPSDMDGKHFQDFRDFCGEVDAEIKAVHPEASVTCRILAPGPGVSPEPDSPAEELTRRITGDNSQNTVPYGTDGGWFQLGGYSTVICGPGDIALAHQPNEFITVEQFEAGEAFLDKLISHLS